jgi:hypothetical protein
VAEAGNNYQAAAKAARRFGQALPDDPERKRFLVDLQRQMSTL